MSPRPDGRHCDACGRTVIDLTRATRAEADALVRARRAQGDGRVCARVLRDVATGDEVFRPEPTRAPPPLRLVAAATLAAACESAYAQGRPAPPPMTQSPDAGVAPTVDGGRAPHPHTARHPTPRHAPNPRRNELWQGDFKLE